jgi:hypothetical protein
MLSCRHHVTIYRGALGPKRTLFSICSQLSFFHRFLIILIRLHRTWQWVGSERYWSDLNLFVSIPLLSSRFFRTQQRYKICCSVLGKIAGRHTRLSRYASLRKSVAFNASPVARKDISARAPPPRSEILLWQRSFFLQMFGFSLRNCLWWWVSICERVFNETPFEDRKRSLSFEESRLPILSHWKFIRMWSLLYTSCFSRFLHWDASFEGLIQETLYLVRLILHCECSIFWSSLSPVIFVYFLVHFSVRMVAPVPVFVADRLCVWIEF